MADEKQNNLDKVKQEEDVKLDGQEPPKDAPPLKVTAWRINNFAKRLLDDRRAKQFATHLLILAKKEPKFASASQESILAAMMACVHLDLIPNTPEQLAFIIPYRNKQGGVDLQFQVGYKGMQELAYRSGQVVAINAELVFPEDRFEVKLGTDRGIVHEPAYAHEGKTIDRTKFERATKVYATAKLVNGADTFEVLTIEELNKIRESSKAKSYDGAWKQWPEIMAKKTAIKRMLKYLPASSKDNRLQYAAVFDSWAEAGRLALGEQGEVVEGKVSKVQSAEKQKATQEKVDKAREALTAGGQK